MATDAPPATSQAESRSSAPFPWLFAIVVLAIVLRLIRLGAYPYWHDEVHNLLASEDLYSTVIQGKLISNHPPLPYILAAAWRTIGLGGSEWTMRLLPALFGVVAVPALYALTRRLFDERTGLIAAFLLAIAPLHVHHSQDLKEYIYLPFVSCLIGIFLHRAFDTNRWRDWIAYGLLAGLGCYTEIFVGPLLVALNLWALSQLFTKRDRWKGWVAGNVLGAVLFVPWLGIMVRKAVGTMIDAESWWVPAPSLLGIAFYIKAVAIGYTAPPMYKVALALFAVLIVAGLLIALIRNPRNGWFLFMWCALPVAAVYGISLMTESIFLIRAMLPYAMGLYIAIAVAIASVPVRTARLSLIALVAVISGLGLGYHYLRIYPPLDFPHRPGTHPPREYDRAADYITGHLQEGDVVVHAAASTWLPFFWYGLRDKPQYTAGVSQQFIRDIAIGNPKNTDDPAMDNYFPQELQTITQDARRVWFIFSEWERKYLDGNAMALWSWLDVHFTEVARESFEGIDIRLYAPAKEATAIARDRDNGVAADITIQGMTQPHRTVRPDSGLIPTPDAQRHGALVLRFADTPPSPPPGQMPSARIVIENTSPVQRSVEFTVLFSDELVDLASLTEPDPTDEFWHVYFQHNPEPPPPNYPVPVASAHFQEPGSGTLVGEIACAPGQYQTLLYQMGLPGDADHARADWSLLLGNTEITSSIGSAGDSTFAWKWYPGLEVRIGSGTVPLRLTAACPEGRAPAFADVKYLALLRNRNTDSTAAPRLPLVLRRVIGAGEVIEHEAVSPAFANRVDAWVYEREPDGLAYHIFRTIQASPETEFPLKSAP